MTTLRFSALQPLCEPVPTEKARLTLALDPGLPCGAEQALEMPAALPGRPLRPRHVKATEIKAQSLRSAEGRAALIHSIVHIELNAIDLALDAVARFPDMPAQYYLDWITVAKEEALHFTLLREHLCSYGYDYGDFDVHNGLWDMAERTRHDVLARMALVPRTLEARGLDASPQVKKKLVGAGDVKAGAILDVILRDEIGHVAIGNRWYRWLCVQRQRDPVSAYSELVQRHAPPPLRRPFNLEARRQAGFDERELQLLESQGS